MQNLIQETLETTYDYIKNAVEELNILAEEFYQMPSEKTWTKLTNLFEGLQWIIQTLTQIDTIQNLDETINDYEIWNQYVKTVMEMNVIIPEIENAMINQDKILIGDILLYEVKPVFNKMLDKLRFLVPGKEGHDVS